MVAHNQKVDEVLGELGVNPDTGLSEQDAKTRLSQYGENRLKEKKKRTLAERFAEQFKDAMILILIGAAIVSFAVAIVERHPAEFIEPVLILLIVIVNAVMGVVQEGKAEKALEALQSLSSQHARVVRDGVERIVESSELVPGDIIRLEAGDFVPADARLVRSTALKSEESALTGESVPSEKDASEIVKADAALGDRHNMVYSGCSITYGTATGVVVETGMNTQMGKIANLLDSEENTQTPLQKKLAELSKYLGFMALAACAIIFVVGLSNGIPPIEIFMTAVSLAVSAIPEGLPAIVTVVLSIGVQRMASQNAIIRRLPAVETLGGASIICSDKTGTLTQNRMTLVKAYLDSTKQMEDISSKNSEKIQELLVYGTLASNGSVLFTDMKEEHIGDPTETAIVLAAHRNGFPKEELNRKYQRLLEIPFDSDRKLMTSVNLMDGKKVVIVKGAFDMMASRCVSGDLESAKKINEEMSNQALRVIAIGYKIIDVLDENADPNAIESGLTFMGLVGMIDPPRPEAKEAVKVCKRAGIKPIMITGDHVVTASAIARELGILSEGETAITGAQLDAMDDAELDRTIETISVYARVSPENKIRIVKAWQRKARIVSMTGDGVNDAPALKAADIGCAMGITGTDVSKGAADMILTDDNFATIVEAVREGRSIYANIKKVVGFLLGTNIGEVITVFTAMLLWHKSPLASMHLLWINLVTDSFPAIALGMEPVEKDIMDKSPKPKNEGLFAYGYGIQIVLQGVMFGVITLLAYHLGSTHMGTHLGGQTMAFLVLSMSQVVQAYNMRSEKSIFKIGVFSNMPLNKASAISVLTVLLVAFTPIHGFFKLAILTPQLYLMAIGLIFVPLVVMELAKAMGFVKINR